MDILYLLASMVCLAGCNLMIGCYNQKTSRIKDATPLFGVIFSLMGTVTWLCFFLRDGQMSWAVLPYAAVFAIGNLVSIISSVAAKKAGPLGITSLLCQMSILCVSGWGFVFWNESASAAILLGTVLIVVSMWLCMSSGEKEQKKINGKWMFYVFITILCNAACTIVQKQQQLDFGGQNGNFFMLLAMGMTLVGCLVRWLWSLKRMEQPPFRQTAVYPFFGGVINALIHLCALLLATSAIPSSVVFPVQAVGGIALTSFGAFLLFHERMGRRQWIGLLIGAAGVALLSI